MLFLEGAKKGVNTFSRNRGWGRKKGRQHRTRQKGLMRKKVCLGGKKLGKLHLGKENIQFKEVLLKKNPRQP